MSIMHRLQDIILERVDSLLQVKDLTAELDCILALTTAARELNLSPPSLLEPDNDVINIRGGRHPLQELCVNQFIKNDTTVGNDSGKLNILTGPNASGKSVYIKQVALIVYLCHIGSYVPCDSCEMSIKDGIYTRVHTMESVSLPLSTFMIDLNQVSNAVLNATKYSCVIIDEFGKGTSAVDGLALLCATLQYWVDMGHDCPNIFLSTHFHQIKEFLQPSGNVMFQTMDVMRSGEDQELVFLYQIKNGFSENSFALHTAKAALIPQPIIDRAEQITQRIRNHEPILRLSSKSSMEQTNRFNHIVDEFLQKDIDCDDMEAFLQEICNE